MTGSGARYRGMAVGLVTVVGLAAAAACLLAPLRLRVETCGAGCFGTVTQPRGGVSHGLLGCRGRAPGRCPRRGARAPPPAPAGSPPARAARAAPGPADVAARRAARHDRRSRILGVVWIEGAGRADLFFSVGVAVAASLTLPGLLVVWRTARSGPDDLALVDALTIASTGGLARVDTYREGLVPAQVPLPEHVRGGPRSTRENCCDPPPPREHLEPLVGRVVVEVMPKPEIPDPQGKAVAGALPRLGFTQFTGVRQGKRFELEVDGDVTDEVLAAAREAGEHVLSNPVIEDVVRWSPPRTPTHRA